MSVRPSSVGACSEIPRGPEDLPLQFRLDATKGELGNGKAHRASDLASSRERMICIRSLPSAVSPPPPIRIRRFGIVVLVGARSARWLRVSVGLRSGKPRRFRRLGLWPEDGVD